MIKNIIRVLCSNIGATIIGVVSSLFFPKVMELGEYAVYQTFILYLSYITILHLGLPTGMFIKYGGKTFSEIDKAKYLGETRLLLMILCFFSVVFILVGAVTSNTIILIVGLSIMPYDYVRSYLSLLQAWGGFKAYSILNFSLIASICLAASSIYIVTGSLSGKQYVYVYVLVYYLVFVWLLFKVHLLSNDSKLTGPIITRDNIETIKLGLTICIGSYVGSLFLSVDKQYIKIFFDDAEFAIYSFAMSLQSIMTVLINSLSQPMYFKLAVSGMSNDDYKMTKEALLLFGSLSSCAYYLCALMVRCFLPKYMGSISIIALFFAVFPAMSVINCLYINLYKARKMTRKYVRSLLLMLFVAIVLDAIVVMVGLDYIYFAVATVVAYYIWLTLGSYDFCELKMSPKDYSFLAAFFASYYLTVNLNPFNEFYGFFVGLVSCMILGWLFYKDSMFGMIKRIR